MNRFERTIYFSGGVALIALGLSLINAKASGFDNTGIGSLDLLYDPAKFAIEFGATYIDRNVEYQISNAQTSRDYLSDTFPPNINPVSGGDTTAAVTPNVWNYAVNAKADLTDNLSCLARIHNPGSILEQAPEDWNGRFSMVKTELTTLGFDATCAVKFMLGGGQQVRFIGGGRYIEADISVDKFSRLLGAPGPAGVVLNGSGFGWRAGIAYELPQYAIRASLIYDHSIDIDATGSVNSVLPLDGQADFTMPKGVEFRVQSGIAPRWLAFAGVKWVNWSSLDKLTVNGSLNGNPFLEVNRLFGFKDGWTLTAGIGHQLTDKIQIGSSITWDQGIGGSYSDTYQWGLGGAYKINDNVTWSLGGAVVYKTAADNETVKSITVIGPGSPSGVIGEDQFDLSYDASVNFAISSKLKLSF